MTLRRKKLKEPPKEYIEKAKALSKEEIERLLARMRGRFTRRLDDKEVSRVNALALQLEFEDEQLEEWRQNIKKIRSKAKD